MLYPQMEAISSLPDILGDVFAQHCVVHLGGCNLVQIEQGPIERFMERSVASAVSGFTEEVYSLGARAPALALEGNHFAEASGVNLAALHRPMRGRAARTRM